MSSPAITFPVEGARSTEVERIARGTALLTERRPRWFWEVDLNRLNLRSPVDCVLGQLWSDYDYGADILDIMWFDEDRHHGFDAYADDYTDRVFNRMLQEWVRVILELRAANP